MPEFPLKGVPAADDVEAWLVDGVHWYLVYRTPTRDVPMSWHIEDPETLTTIFGDRTPTPDRKLSQQQYDATGAIDSGQSAELVNLGDHPFDSFMAAYEREAQTQPWLRDPEVLGVTMAAILEGRNPTPAELQTTEWFQTRSESERSWLLLNASDPATAEQLLLDNRSMVRRLFEDNNVTPPDDEIIATIADLHTQGQVTERQLVDSVAAIANPQSGATLADEIADAFAGSSLPEVEPSARADERVRQLALEHLGPVYGNWTDGQVDRWARRIATDENAEAELRQSLRNQLSRIYGIDDPTLTWQDLAQPWISMTSRMWGRNVEGTDPIVERLIQLNDGAQAQELLRREGLNRGVGQVRNQALSALQQTLGTPVRPVI